MKKHIKPLSLVVAIFAGFLGVLYFYNDNVQTYLKAQSGDIDAEIELGTHYYNAGNLPAAVEWYQKAADQFDSDALFNLGVIYQTGGEGVPKDEKTAAMLYEKAARQGHVLAQYNFGLMHAKGQYVQQSFSLAFSWFEQAAMQGLKEAQFIAGEMNESGEPGSKNLVEAYKWYSIANATERLARLESKMSQEEIGKAKKLASEWKVTE